MSNESSNLPRELNFENLSKTFMSLVAERYPSSDKVLKLAAKLGVEGNIPAQIVVFTQFRDAVKQVSLPLIFRSVEHRDAVFDAIIGALENLEDIMDQQFEEERDDEDEPVTREE